MTLFIQLKIRRGLKVNLPTLAEGELGFCTDTKEVFIGTSSGNVRLDETYTAATPGNWSGTPPTTLGTAIDRLSTAVEGLLGGPIP